MEPRTLLMIMCYCPLAILCVILQGINDSPNHEHHPSIMSALYTSTLQCYEKKTSATDRVIPIIILGGKRHGVHR
jgi:hypothetical protein